MGVGKVILYALDDWHHQICIFQIIKTVSIFEIGKKFKHCCLFCCLCVNMQ